MPWPTESRDARLAAGVRAIYRRLDRRIAAFRRRSALACLPGCGECCRSAEVEATVLELLPLALELLRRGRVEEILDRLDGARVPDRCVLFSERPLGRFGGHCGDYRRRPLICRMFGFAAMEGREARPDLVACRLVRQADRGSTERATLAVADGRLAVPRMRDYALAIYRLEPVLGSGALPINEALRQVLHRVALTARLGRGSRTAQQVSHPPR